MVEIKGRLRFLGWRHKPWVIEADDGIQVDLFPLLDVFLRGLNNKLATHTRDNVSYELRSDETSDFYLVYSPDEGLVCPVLSHKEFGFSNVTAYFESTAIWLTGRKVIVTFEDGDPKQFRIAADPEEVVHKTKFFGNGNSSRIWREKTVCQVGTENCCIFAVCGPAGFCCEKFNDPIARILLDRLARNEIRATRLGNCENIGREDSNG